MAAPSIADLMCEIPDSADPHQPMIGGFWPFPALLLAPQQTRLIRRTIALSGDARRSCGYHAVQDTAATTPARCRTAAPPSIGALINLAAAACH